MRGGIKYEEEIINRIGNGIQSFILPGVEEAIIQMPKMQQNHLQRQKTQVAAESSNRWINVNASLPLNYDPASGSSSIDLSIVFNVYDTLVFTEIDGTVIPHVADRLGVFR